MGISFWRLWGSVFFLDLAWSTPLLAGPNGVFFAAQGTVVNAPYIPSRSAAVGDLNNDGVDDFVAANGTFALGSNTGAFRSLLLNENGSAYRWFMSNPTSGTPSMTGFRAALAADFNGDGRKDVVTLSTPLDLEIFINQGTQTSATGFGAGQVIQSLLGLLQHPLSPTLNDPVLEFPVLLADDFDGDGNQDILFTDRKTHYWTGTMWSTGTFVLWGRGDGTFLPAVQIAAGDAPIDGIFVDWDGNGSRETLLQLEQTVQYAFNYSAQIKRFTFQGRNISAQVQPTWVGPYLLTGMAYIPARGWEPRRVVFSGHSFPYSWIMAPELYVLPLDVNGNTLGLGTVPILNTFAKPNANSEMQGIKTADFDGDGELDVVALHEIDLDSSGAIVPAEVIFIKGPIDSYGNSAGEGSFDFPGTTTGTTNKAPRANVATPITYTPNRSVPGGLLLADLNSDSLPDIVTGNLYVPINPGNPTSSANIGIATITNFTGMITPTLPSVVRIPGTGTPSPNGVLARCGVSGGKPTLANPNFKITLGDAPTSGIASLWGSTTQVNWTHQGLNLGILGDAASDLMPLLAGPQGRSEAQYSLPVPNTPALVGMPAFFQWVVLDTTASTPFPFYCSEAIGVTVGQ